MKEPLACLALAGVLAGVAAGTAVAATGVGVLFTAFASAADEKGEGVGVVGEDANAGVAIADSRAVMTTVPTSRGTNASRPWSFKAMSFHKKKSLRVSGNIRLRGRERHRNMTLVHSG